jgi:glyoxylase-like metal-dependent hydrolase (beta-lactamase superfamily II)
MSYRTLALIGLALWLSAGGLFVFAASTHQEPLGDNVKDLGGGHHVYMEMSNAGFVVTDDGILVVDALISPNHARRLLKEIRKVSDRPIRHLVNTHWHSDHTFGNGAFPDATEILSTEACKARLEKDGPARWAEAAESRPSDYEGAKLVIPEVTFTDETTLKLGDREIRVKHLGPGHTLGDAVIIDPEARVIYAGDLLFNGIHPYMADGHSKEWVDALQALEDLARPEPETWKVVPGHGEPTSITLASDMREYILTLRTEVQKALDQGIPPEEMAARIALPAKVADLKAPDFLEKNIRRIAEELTP